MEDLKKNIKELQEKLDNNATRIIENMNRLHNHEEMINNNSSRIEQNSYALSILKDYKNGSRRLFIVLIIVLIMWFITAAYLVYVLNDTGTIEETVTQENENGYNNYIGNDGEIINGKADN